MTDRLAEMFEAQRRLQTDAYKADPANLSDLDKVQFIKDMVMALEDELHEALAEVGWKPWATSRHINREAYTGELVDAFHFFMNLCLVVDLGPEELYRKYRAKREKNLKRQQEGYDGVKGKCPGCKRALDDEAVRCYLAPLNAAMEGYVYCKEKHDWFPYLKLRG